MSVFILIAVAGLIVTSMSLLYLGSRVTELSLPHAALESPERPSKALVIILSGPGGWIEFDQGLAEHLCASGMDVRGVDYLRYFFWKKRSPLQLSQDLSAVIREWLKGRSDSGKIILAGYSKGADVLPFAANLLEPELRSRIQLIALISVSRLADFRLRLTELLQGGYGPFALKVGPEIKKLENIEGLCIYGDQDRVSLCRNLKGISNTMEVHEVKSGHVFHDSKSVADLILRKFKKDVSKKVDVLSSSQDPVIKPLATKATSATSTPTTTATRPPSTGISKSPLTRSSLRTRTSNSVSPRFIPRKMEERHP